MTNVDWHLTTLQGYVLQARLSIGKVEKDIIDHLRAYPNFDARHARKRLLAAYENLRLHQMALDAYKKGKGIE